MVRNISDDILFQSKNIFINIFRNKIFLFFIYHTHLFIVSTSIKTVALLQDASFIKRVFIFHLITIEKKQREAVNRIVKILCRSIQSRKLPVARGAETFGSYKSKHPSGCASGISRLSRGIKATLTFSCLRTRRPGRVRVTYTQKLTPPACRERLRAHSVGSTGHRVKYDCIPANVRRMGRKGTRDRGISDG